MYLLDNRHNNPAIDSDDDEEEVNVPAAKASDGRAGRSNKKEVVEIDEGPFSPEREDDGSLKIEKVLYN